MAPLQAAILAPVSPEYKVLARQVYFFKLLGLIEKTHEKLCVVAIFLHREK